MVTEKSRYQCRIRTKQRPCLFFCVALLLISAAASPPSASAADPKERAGDIGYPGTVSELAQPQNRSPGSPVYSDIIFSPRRTWWAEHDVVDLARAFNATRIDWMYVDDGDFQVVREFQDIGISTGTAFHSVMWDTLEKRRAPVGFAARPDYYTVGRVLDIDGNIEAGMLSIHDPSAHEVVKKWLRLHGELGVDHIHMDDPDWHYRDWDFNPHALEQFNNYLSMNVNPETLEQIGIDDPLEFDLREYILNEEPEGDVPAQLEKIWEDFRLEALLDWYKDLRSWTAELVGDHVEWSANYTSFVNFAPQYTQWTDFIVTEVQPSGGNFGIANPWSLYQKVKVSRELGKALVFTLGAQDIYENKIMIGLTYAMGTHMLVPYGVYMKDRPRRFDDPEIYADIYDFVARWGERYLDGYEEAFVLGNGITHPLTRYGIAPPIELEDSSGSVYAFVRARPGDPEAPVVIHLVNWSRSARCELGLTMNPDRFFPERGLKTTLLRPGHEPEVLSDGFEAHLELPSPEPWQMLILEPSSDGDAGAVWAPELEAESREFFDHLYAGLHSRTSGAEIHYTLDGTEPARDSMRYSRPVLIEESAQLKARAFTGEGASSVSSFSFTRREPNAVPVDPGELSGGLAYELRENIDVATLASRADPEEWKKRNYEYEKSRTGAVDALAFPEDHPESNFAVNFTGCIEVPRGGLYTFYAVANDQMRLYIGEEMTINHCGRKSALPDIEVVELEGSALLSEGLHEFRLEYIQMWGESELQLEWEGPGIERQTVPDGIFKH